MSEFKEKMDKIMADIKSPSNLKISKEPGFVAVSLSKVVEINDNSICVICIDAEEFEFSMLDAIFAPTPRDEYVRDMVEDILTDKSDKVEALFEIVKDVMGAGVETVKREDYESWRIAYNKEFVDLVNNGTENIDHDNTKVESIVLKGAEDLLFLIFVDGEARVSALIGHDDDGEETLEDFEEDPVFEDYDNEYEGVIEDEED